MRFKVNMKEEVSYRDGDFRLKKVNMGLMNLNLKIRKESNLN